MCKDFDDWTKAWTEINGLISGARRPTSMTRDRSRSPGRPLDGRHADDRHARRVTPASFAPATAAWLYRHPRDASSASCWPLPLGWLVIAYLGSLASCS